MPIAYRVLVMVRVGIGVGLVDSVFSSYEGRKLNKELI